MPVYLGFEHHWTSVIAWVLSGLIGLVGFFGTLIEVSKLWPRRNKGFNDNLAVALFLAGIAVLFHYLGEWAPWMWLTVMMRVIAISVMLLAAMGFAMSTEDAIKATLTHADGSARRRVWNAVKTLGALNLGLLSAGAAAVELFRVIS